MTPISTKTPSPPTARDSYHAWINVALCGLGIFFVMAAPGTVIPLLYGTIMEDMNWSFGQVSGFSSWKFLSAALTSLALSFMVERYSLKAIMIFGSALASIALMSMPLISSLWAFYMLGFMLGTSVIIILIGCKILLSRWFHENLGLAVGIAFVAGSFAGVIMPFIGLILLESFGWKTTVSVLGLIIFLLVIPAFSIGIRDFPSRSGDADKALGAAPGNATGTLISPVNGIIQSKLFWFIMLACFLLGGADHSIKEHTALFIEKDTSLGVAGAAAALTIAMTAGIFGKLGFGWLFDRFSTRGIAACWWLLALGIALGMLVSDFVTMTLFAFIRGAAHGGVLIASICLAKHIFDYRSIPQIVCYLSVSTMLGGSISTALTGFIRDYTGSYDVAFAILIVQAVIAGIIVLLVTPKHWDEPTSPLTMR